MATESPAAKRQIAKLGSNMGKVRDDMYIYKKSIYIYINMYYFIMSIIVNAFITYSD